LTLGKTKSRYLFGPLQINGISLTKDLLFLFGEFMSSKKIRPAPAYQEYASDILANANYKMMSFAERGLLDTMRKECWVNHSIPSDKSELALYLRCPQEEIYTFLTNRVASFFKEQDGIFICSELESYRQNQIERQQKISEGGRRGGKTTQEKIKSSQGGLQGSVKPLRGGELNRVERKGDDKKLLRMELTEDAKDWENEYSNAPDAVTYLKASRG
jgi:hypothetical protein